MKKKFFFAFFIFFIFFIHIVAHPQSLTCDYLVELGKKALKNKDYQEAKHYFKLAKTLCPSYKEVCLYLDSVNGNKEQSGEKTQRASKRKRGAILEALETWEDKLIIKKSSRQKENSISLKKEKYSLEKKEIKISKFLDLWEKKLLKSTSFKETKIKKEKKKKRNKEKIRTLYLTDELFKTQPKTLLEIEINKSLIIEGKNILRYLIESPQIIQVEKINTDRIKITAKEIGSTFFHLWEEKKRWTFNVRVNPPLIHLLSKEETLIYEEKPFKIAYDTNWQSYYRGPHIENMERTSYSLSQGLRIAGPTPYGNIDGSMTIIRADKKTKISGYSAGITQGNIGIFKEFNLRGFDFFGKLSDFSLPGETLRGILWQIPMFNKKINYTLLWGREREGIYGYLAPGVLKKRESYIEGLKFALFPYQNKNISFSFAKRYGEKRDSYLKERVYALEGNWGNVNKNFYWEIGFDEDSFAGILNTTFRFPKLELNLNFRNIEKNFVTIAGYPGGRGEKGIIFTTNWTPKENLNFVSNINIYRTKYLYNEAEPKKINFTWDTTFSLNFNPSSSLLFAFYYLNEPQLSFPRRYLNLNTTYSINLKLFNRTVSPFLNMGFSRNTNPLSPSSNYNRLNTRGGMRISLTKDIFYYLSYEWSWLKERFNKSTSHPSVLEIGLDCQKDIASLFSIDMNFLYRNEENALSTHSFLAGEDSLESSLRLTYTPSKDTEIFVEGNLRNVWKENLNVESYKEADLRWGIRGYWDTFLKWNPKGKICGVVFKDINGNSQKEDSEPFIKEVKIKVGKKELTTNEQGFFCTTIRAKKAIVKIDPNSLPEGYVLTTPSSYEIEISSGKKTFITFGASIFSSICGVVFVDSNSNGKFDRGEKPLPYVKITLGEKTAFTNLEGCYYFKHLETGTYTLKLDIDSLPLNFLPLVPLEKKIELAKGVNYIYSFPVRKKE